MMGSQETIIEQITRCSQSIAQFADKNIFWVNSANNALLPVLWNSLFDTEIPHAEIPVLSFVNASLGLIVGTHQLRNQDTHRPIAEKIKGLLNVLNGTQQIVISSINLSILCPPSLIASAAICFTISLDDLVQTAQKLSPIYWIQDAQEKRSKTKSGSKERKQLDQDIMTQVHALLIQDKETNTLKNQQALLALFSQEKLASMKRKLEIRMKINSRLSDQIKNNQATLQATNNTAFRYATENTLIAGLTLIGAILLCIPGLQVPGLAILATATIAFAAKFIAVNVVSQLMVKKEVSKFTTPKNTPNEADALAKKS